ncbi:MAG: serine hydrolase [Hyphomonas sp.]|uniref:serine hydrolase domain-containing protein n=1 Tax=Hyphomonas sp. TaxID=87 RepID=UPI001D9C0F84|nr:serine hydrolase [Hyphomonas sp.]MBA4226396.1 serine hydrolase [Hyphomonas sp.]
MPTFRAALAALALSIPLALPAMAQEGGTTEDTQRALAAGWKATFTCSGLFVAGQTQQELDQNELSGIYPDYARYFDQLPPARIDQSRKTVSVDYSPLMPPRLAAYRPGFGCTQLPVGATEKALDFLPRFAAWPEYTTQDRGSAIGSNVKVELRLEEAERLEMPVTAAFDEMTYGAGTRTSSVIVVRDGQVVAERYARGVEHETPQRTWSVGKSLTATIIGAARRQGLIDIDYPAVIAAWNKGADPRREITIRNLLHMASGLDSGENGSRTDRLYFGGGRVVDQAATSILEVEPGSRFKYANNDTVIAMRALREAMADDTRFHRFPYEAVLHKIGAVRTTMEIDWNGDFISSSQVWATGRDLARIGQLYLQDGMWAGERLLPEGWVEFVRTPAPAQPADAASRGGYGAQFWLMNNVPGVPEGTFYAAGNRGQYIVILPALRTVVVRQGYDTIGGARFDIERFVLDVTRALQAADADRGLAAEDLRRAAEAENAAAATRRPR